MKSKTLKIEHQTIEVEYILMGSKIEVIDIITNEIAVDNAIREHIRDEAEYAADCRRDFIKDR